MCVSAENAEGCSPQPRSICRGSLRCSQVRVTATMRSDRTSIPALRRRLLPSGAQAYTMSPPHRWAAASRVALLIASLKNQQTSRSAPACSIAWPLRIARLDERRQHDLCQNGFARRLEHGGGFVPVARDTAPMRLALPVRRALGSSSLEVRMESRSSWRTLPHRLPDIVDSRSPGVSPG